MAEKTYGEYIEYYENIVKEKKLKKIKLTGITTNAHDEINYNFDLISKFNSNFFDMFERTDNRIKNNQNSIELIFEGINKQIDRIEEYLDIDTSSFKSVEDSETLSVFNIQIENIKNFLPDGIDKDNVNIINQDYGEIYTGDDYGLPGIDLSDDDKNNILEATKATDNETTKNKSIGVGHYYIRNYFKKTKTKNVVLSTPVNTSGLNIKTDGSVEIDYGSNDGDNGTIKIETNVSGSASSNLVISYSLNYYDYYNNSCDCLIEKTSNKVRFGDIDYIITEDDDSNSDSGLSLSYRFMQIVDDGYGIILPYNTNEWKLLKPIFEIEISKNTESSNSDTEKTYRINSIIMPLAYYKTKESNEIKLLSHRFYFDKNEVVSIKSNISTYNINDENDMYTMKGTYTFTK